jgi:hypothetical protein
VHLVQWAKTPCPELWSYNFQYYPKSSLGASFQDGIVEFNQDSIPKVFGHHEFGIAILVALVNFIFGGYHRVLSLYLHGENPRSDLCWFYWQWQSAPYWRHCLEILDFLQGKNVRSVDQTTILVHYSLSRGITFAKPLSQSGCYNWWWFGSGYYK